jgi:membrane protein DedA with SNARE-associated domain
MNLEQFGADALAFVKTHKAWAPHVVALISFAESIIFLSWLLPASLLLIGVGAVVAAGDLDPWSIVAGATIGAALGEWFSYGLGRWMKGGIVNIWPISRHPELVQRGERLVKSWGYAGIFFAKFIGPLRGIVPMIAGVFRMNQLRFQIANWTSSLAWSLFWLAPGFFGAEWLLGRL